MMRNLLGKWLLLAAVCSFFVGCQQLAEEEDIPQKGGVLNVKARSAADTEVFYPMSLYAFTVDGACAASQTIASETDAIGLQLPAGTYRVVLVSGDPEVYTFPANPTLDSLIQLEGTAGASSPLMMGMADVTIGTDTEARLELMLSYAVASIDVALTELPEEVSEVTVTLSSFYGALQMNGSYVEAGQPLVMSCTQGEDQTWRTDTCYVFPGSTTETVFSIRLKMADSSEVTYGYTWKDSPKANHPYHIYGNYSSGITLGGNFVIGGWDEATDVEFEFGAVSQSDSDGGSSEEPGISVSELPEQGSIWNGAIVASVGEADSEGVDLLLLSLDEWDIYTDQVEELISGYSVNGMAGWRLPTYEEAQLLRNSFSDTNRTDLNERIAEYDAELVGIDGEERYLCNKSGSYYSFIFAGGTTITQCGTQRSYYARLVKDVRVTN